MQLKLCPCTHLLSDYLPAYVLSDKFVCHLIRMAIHFAHSVFQFMLKVLRQHITYQVNFDPFASQSGYNLPARPHLLLKKGRAIDDIV